MVLRKALDGVHGQEAPAAKNDLPRRVPREVRQRLGEKG